jgi:predicted RNA binding protein YcfA (HicA-like mRNA interferase family)
MGQLSGISGRDIRRVAEAEGWRYQRNHGDHMVMKKDGNPLNLSIPDHRELNPGMARVLIRIMGMSVAEFRRALGRR